MSEITDKDLSSIYSSLSSCSPLVRGLAERLRRVEEEQLLSGVCEVCTSKVLVENTALRERMKRMEEALRFYAHERIWVEIESDRGKIAQAALKRGE